MDMGEGLGCPFLECRAEPQLLGKVMGIFHADFVCFVFLGVRGTEAHRVQATGTLSACPFSRVPFLLGVKGRPKGR